MNKRKLLLSLGTVAAIAAPVATVVSCGTEKDSVTLVVPQASSMNFVRYQAAANLAAPTALPFMEVMPGDSIKNKYQLQSFKMKAKAGGTATLGHVTYGAILPDEKGGTFTLDQSGKNVQIVIRSNMRWSNGDPLVAENWVDTIKAMLDLNNASEYVNEIERMGINNATESYDAQIEYFRIHKEAYADPFNYNNLPVWPKDGNKVDEDAWTEADKIGKAFPKILNPCLELGVENDGSNILLLHFNHKESLNFILGVQTPVFWPINRKFIMSIGGFDKFGTTTDKMVSSGAYTANYFDSKYGVEFGENNKYYNRAAVITPNINFRFVKNPNTNAALFETGQVLQTPIGKDYIAQYLSDPTLRERSSRSTGVGTLSMFLNRSKTSISKDHQEIFGNINFRKALYYGIDRSQLLPALQLPFSNPVSIYTAAIAKTQDSDNYMEVFRGDMYHAKVVDQDGEVTADVKKPMLISPTESRGYTYSQDFFKRNDPIYDPTLAKKFLAQAETDLKHPINVVLDYPYDSSDPIGKAVSIVLQDFLNKTFGGKIKINAKALPKIVYSQYISSGQWDLQIKQVDPLTRKPWDYLGEFVEPDDVDPTNGKKSGFIKNNTGGATYKDYFNSLTEEQEKTFRDSYGIAEVPAANAKISKFSFDVVKWFTTYEEFNEDSSSEFSKGKPFDNDGLKRIIDFYQANYDADTMSNLEKELFKEIKEFYASELTPFLQIYNQAVSAGDSKEIQVAAKKIIQSKVAFMESTIPFNVSFNTVYKVIEAIQRDMVPVIPLAEADNRWTASRSQGASATPQGQWANPEYLYDADNKPSASLEGVIT